MTESIAWHGHGNLQQSHPSILTGCLLLRLIFDPANKDYVAEQTLTVELDSVLQSPGTKIGGAFVLSTLDDAQDAHFSTTNQLLKTVIQVNVANTNNNGRNLSRHLRCMPRCSASCNFLGELALGMKNTDGGDVAYWR